MLFDLPLQAIAKMIVEYGLDADIAAEASRLEEKDTPEEIVENSSLHPIEEAPEEEEENAEEPAVATIQLPPRRRSYSPAEHAWGDDEADDDPAVEVDIEEPASDEADIHKVEEEEEEEDADNEVHDPITSQSTATHINGFVSSPGGEHRNEDPAVYDENEYDEYSDRELDFSGDSDDSDQREWVA